MGIENYRRDSALHARDLEDLVLENLAKGEDALRAKQADNIVFTCDLVNICNLGEFHEAVSNLLQLFRLDEQV